MQLLQILTSQPTQYEAKHEEIMNNLQRAYDRDIAEKTRDTLTFSKQSKTPQPRHNQQHISLGWWTSGENPKGHPSTIKVLLALVSL